MCTVFKLKLNVSVLRFADWRIEFFFLHQVEPHVRSVMFYLTYRRVDSARHFSHQDVVARERWTGTERLTGRRTKIESSWYLNTKIVEEISQQWRKRDGDRKGNGAERVGGMERMTHPSVESTYLLSSSPSLSRAEAICTWVPHSRRQPSHNYPQMAVATSVTHGKAGPAVKLCMLLSASHLP